MKRVVCKVEEVLYVRLVRLKQAAGVPLSRIMRRALETEIARVLLESKETRERFERYTIEDEARAADLLLRDRARKKPTLHIIERKVSE